MEYFTTSLLSSDVKCFMGVDLHDLERFAVLSEDVDFPLMSIRQSDRVPVVFEQLFDVEIHFHLLDNDHYLHIVVEK